MSCLPRRVPGRVVTRRISDVLAERVVEGIQALPILDAARQQVDWEVTPMLMPDNTGELILAFMVALSVPVPGSVEGDRVLYMAPLRDPDAGQVQVTDFVWKLYRQCDADTAARQAQLVTAAGSRR